MLLSWLRRLRWLFRDVLGRRRFERELDEELATWLALAEEDAVRRGLSPEAARRQARLALGGLEPARAAVRDSRRGAGLESVWQDVRHAARRLRRQPSFTVVAMLTLALGIGANAAILSAVRSVLLAPLPFADSGRLVRILISRPTSAGPVEHVAVLPTWFHEIRERSRLLAHLTAQRYHNLILTGSGDAAPVVGIGVSEGWPETLGVAPIAGRGFLDTELREGQAARVVLLSHALWQDRFGGDPGVLGRRIQLNGTPYDVIGVMPPGFRYPYDTDLWMPMTVARDPEAPGDLNVAARLAPGATVEALQAELTGIAREAARLDLARTSTLGLYARPMAEEFRRDPNRSLTVLTAGVALVLVLACVNLATLLLARGAAHGHEVALHGALGAGPARQLRRLLTETMLLAGCGGLLGVAVAWVGADRLSVLIPPRLGEVIPAVTPDAPVLVVSVALCLASGLGAGLMPAWRLTRTSLTDALRDGQRPGEARSGRLLRGLVIGEVALASLLVVGAGTLARHVIDLLGRDVGYEPAGLMRMNLTLPEPAYTDGRRRGSAIAALLDRVRDVPGVDAAAVTSLQPVPRTSSNVGTRVATPGMAAAGAPAPVMNFRLVTPEYFATLRLPVGQGRAFGTADAPDAEPVVAVSEAAARRLWPDQAPLDQRLRVGSAAAAPWRRVVAVVGDQAEPDDDERETVYLPYAQGTLLLAPGTWSTTGVTLLVRTGAARDPGALLADVRAAVREVDSDLPVYDATSMIAAIGEPLADQRLGAVFVGAFGLFGLVLAALGVYGTLAYSVTLRRSEFGIRLALGAGRARILGGVLREGLSLVIAGLGIGLVAAFALANALTRLVEGLGAPEAATWGASAGVLVAVGLGACVLPAWRAVRVDPRRLF